ncbi:hypothetical protein Tco_0298540 [Tanacetum coccineum]
MSQINSECLFFDDTDDETEVNSLLSGFLIDAALVIQASTPTIQKYQRSYMPRDRYGAHDRLVLAYFAKKPFYNAYLFRKRFRMNRSLFTRIVRDLSANCPYFQEGCDAVGKAGISALVKCTSAIRQLAYAVVHPHSYLMYTCIILHNMIHKEKGKAISPDFYPEEQHRENDPVRSAQDRLRVIREIHDEETHLNFKADLVEHIWHRTNAN